ncbi:uncharacterized protein LOC124459863 [Drosophila willistoni]|uniref:uncharacterized protein LOC124459863 n=1 Tax=Drosophila willistoni TaxID=7260 RepID=UPI001F07813C|nr:uncharacterized protein LOC124459863 [Drosophila willistoni]
MDSSSESLIFVDGSTVLITSEIVIILFLTAVLVNLKKRINKLSDSIRLMIFNYNKILLLVGELHDLKIYFNRDKNNINLLASVSHLETFAKRHMEFNELYSQIQEVYNSSKPNEIANNF